jgi:hypothetical protein
MKDFREQYDKLHAVCPVCKSASIEVSCVGCLMDNLETARDANRAQCECGWRGIVHDMVPAPEE